MRAGSVVSFLATFVCATLVVACASSSGGLPPDAEPVLDASAIDAGVPDAGPPDAEPCIPDPKGDICNGEDDDCDGTTDEGYPGVGDACDVGIGACNVEGVTECTKDGQATTCGATAGTPGTELCGTGIDEDCDVAVDEGFDDLGDVCSVGAGACLASGIMVCDSTGLDTACNAVPGGGTVEICDGVDNDCDTFIDDGFQVSQSCDGADGDMCNEGVWACDGAGGRECTDQTTTTFDLCDGFDNDCDPTSGDGTEDGAVGAACDGAAAGQDSDLCPEGTRQCVSGALYCNDETTSTLDICDGANNDCDAASADGSEDDALGDTCDGTDADLCATGAWSCGGGGSLVCSDDAATAVDICDGIDNDCNPATLDGSGQGGFGAACDSPSDTDLCTTGTMACNSGTATLYCTDDGTSLLDVCDGVDNDCDVASVDGAEQATYGNACDNPTDSDLCATGAIVCNSATSALYCNDDLAETLDLCGNGDEDCDLSSNDGTEAPGYNATCDSGDSDLCATGNMLCSGTSLACSDPAGDSTVDLCGGGDQDCDGASADGSEHPGYNATCDSSVDTDLCATGNMLCSGTSLACNDPGGDSTLDLCGGGDQDCDTGSGDGSEQAGFGVACDGGDSDLCTTGQGVCSGTSVVCNDDAASTLDLCGNGDEDCDPASNDGTEQTGWNQPCDGTDADSCTTGVNFCSGASLVCSDDASTTSETCDGTDEDCDGFIDDGWSGNDNTGCWSVNMGTVSGDTGANVISSSSWNEEWFLFRVTEDSNSDIYLSATVDLYSPAGTDFDLYGYCFDCTGGAVNSSTVRSTAGHWDTIRFRGDDDTPFPLGEDDDHWIIVEVRWVSQTRCDTYTIQVTGNTAVTTNTCNI